MANDTIIVMGSGDELRDFKGVFIPKEIWLSSELTPTEKLVWAEINSLDREFGCVADNAHFEKVLKLSERQVQDYIKRLKNKGFIEVNLNKAKNTRTIRIAGKYAHISEEQIRKIGFLKQELVDRYQQRGFEE